MNSVDSKVLIIFVINTVYLARCILIGVGIAAAKVGKDRSCLAMVVIIECSIVVLRQLWVLNSRK